MNEKAICESVFKQKEVSMEDFTEIMARLINAVEHSKAKLSGII